MSATASADKKFGALKIGARVKALRKARGLSLNDLSRMTDMSEATLSRVENEQTPIGAHNLYALSQVLGADMTAFFVKDAEPIGSGVRAITRRNGGLAVETSRYAAQVLCTDLSNKKMHPAINLVSVRSLEEAGGFNRHSGEEFLLVLDGTLVLHTRYYAPLMMEAGDSVYFDGTMDHAYVNGGNAPARILVVITTDGPLGETGKPANQEPGL